MNTQLVYTKKAFANSPVIFSGDVVATPEQKRDYILNMSNNCRSWYSPVFINESKYLPVSDPSIVSLNNLKQDNNTALTLNDVSELTNPPQKQKITDIQKGLILAGAALIIIKLLS